MSQDSLKTELDQLECHFTWELKQKDVDLQDLLNRLEEQDELGIGKSEGVARAHSFIGYVKFLLGDKEEALKHLKQSEAQFKESFGDHCDKRLIVNYGNLAWLNYHMKNYTECERYLKELHEINERFPTKSVPEVLGEKGWTFLKFSNKYYEQGKEFLRKAVEMDPDDSEWNAGYAIALYRTEAETCTGDSPAIKQLRKAIDKNPDDDVLKVHLGIKLMLCSKELMNKSQKLVDAALSRSPDNPHVVRYTCKYFRHRGLVDRSIELLENSLKSSKGTAFVHHQLATCYRNKKMYLQKENKDSYLTEINETREKSICHLKIATSLKADFIVAMSELALLYGEKGERDLAEELFEKTFTTATEKKDDLHVVHYYYARFQLYCGKNTEKALKHYMECLKTDPQTSEGTRSAYKLKMMAQSLLKEDPRDEKGINIMTLIRQKRPDLCEANNADKAVEVDGDL